MLLKEVIVENFTDIPRQVALADRIIVADNLAVGGTTTSKGIIAEATRYVHEHDKAITFMIRPRGGDDIYSDTEVKIMEADIFEAQAQGADGIMVGALTPQNTIDTDAMEQFIAAANGMTIIFNAFDQITPAQQPAALAWLSDHQIDQVITRGTNDLTQPLNIAHIKEIIKWADQQILVVPSGVTKDNAAQIATELGVKLVCGTNLM